MQDFAQDQQSNDFSWCSSGNPENDDAIISTIFFYNGVQNQELNPVNKVYNEQKTLLRSQSVDWMIGNVAVKLF